MIKQNNKQFIVKIIPGAVLGIIFAILLYQVMVFGPWAYNDSSAYVSAARNIADGNGSVILHSTGKVKLLTEFPPFYPFFLSIFGGIDGDYILITRILNAVLFALSIFLFYVLILELSKSVLLSILAALLFASFEHTIRIFTGIMSETLFLPLLFLTWLLLIVYIKNKKRIPLYISLIIVSAILPITRYAGIVFIAVIWFYLLLLDRSKLSLQKILLSSIYPVFSFLPIGIWAVSLLTQFGKFGGKNFSLNWSIFRSLLISFKEVLSVLAQWIPYAMQYQGSWFSSLFQYLFGLCFLCIFFFSIRNFVKKSSINPDIDLSILLLFNLSIVGYTSLIVFMHATSSPQIDIIDRTILPLMPLLITSLTVAIAGIIASYNRKNILLAFFTILSLIFIRYNVLYTQDHLHKLSVDGIGYTSRELRDAGIISALKEIDKDRITISNLSGFVLFHTNEYPIFIENFPHYRFGDGDSYGETEFRESNAALIIFKSDFINFYGPNAKSLYQKVTESLIIEYEDDQAVIFAYQPVIQP